MNQFNLSYHLREGFHSIFTHGLMSFAAVFMILACLVIMGSFSLVAITMDNTLGTLEAQNEFTAYVDDTLTDDQVRAIQTELEKIPNVSSVIFVSGQKAMENYKQRYVDSENIGLFDGLPEDVLRHRYRIHVVSIETMADTTKAVERVAGIAEVRAELEIAKGFVTMRNVATAVAAILMAILAIIAIFIITNTIKLATFHRREEISIMKMCGATNWFVRWPFIIEGILLGLMGAFLAFFCQWGIYALMVQAITDYGGLQLIALTPFKDMAVRMALIFTGAGVAIGAGGSLFAIRKFLQV